ncbi:MAG TPA: hypothetical protein PLU71_03055 [Candidatus Dependentiae bacterium]|nr:hypothetical protein [Candidatus Dependentiae bacterium]HRQ62810.1 hypothetical protein [Candidatus Dependentiae bacterium]
MNKVNKKHTRSIVYMVVCTLILLPSCGQKTTKRKLTITLSKPAITAPLTQQRPPITIWIHGTRFFPRRALQEAFHGKTGLKKAAEFPDNHYLRDIAHTLFIYEPERFPFDSFYFYGWSGKLNAEIRAQTARVLYAEIKKLVTAYKLEYGYAPQIQLITHSHGGNVALNLATVEDETPFIIDTLVMLACPVQTKTMDLIGSPMFEHVYVLYSSLDIVQIIAPQLRKKHCSSKHAIKFPPFSHRRFPNHPHVTQAKIKINGRAIFHNEFNKPYFLRLLPSTLREITIWHKNANDQPFAKNLLCLYTKYPKNIH